MSNLIEVKHINKTYGKGVNKLEILADINLSIKQEDNLALVGPSGCGKTTFLQILGLLDIPTKGQINFSGKDIANANDKLRTDYRRENIGFIYQYHHLMPEFTALENVMMPLLINKVKISDAEKEATKTLTSLGLKDRLLHKPSSLSGGEKQRVAIARALVAKPKILLADEPTGNLDPKNAELVFDLFLSEVKKRKQTTIIVTHNIDLAKKLEKVISIKDGKIVKL